MEAYSCVISEKFKSKKGRDTFYITSFVKGKKVFIGPYLSDTTDNLWNCVDTGDSIYKPAGILEFTVFKKNGDTLKCYYSCDDWNRRYP